ncbi:hypothetical protein ACN2XU_08055 [Primorskyibacter sp. 2E107]|uniref:hypothetical protein n=1 Tax=Primorskyibacter sp. 2E107 TaxID=3403458 RepID=UPI003AF5131C
MNELLPNMRSLSSRFAFLRPDTAPATSRPVTKTLPVGPLRPRVEIPVRDPSPAWAEAQALIERGQHMARQDEWEALGREICDADREHRLTEGLGSVAALLAQGARRDAVEAGRAATKKAEPKVARTILATLEINMEDMPQCPATAYIVAMAHVDLALAWAGASRPGELATPRRDAFDWHMAAAARLSDEFDPFQTQSPLWAEVRCRVLAVDPKPSLRLADDYEDLIEMEPENPDHMRCFGRDLMPGRYGNREVLDRESRRTAIRTADVWGMGGYSWIQMGAIEHDPSALRWLDDELFAEGLHDILSRHPGQDMVNRLAAFCGLTASSASAPGSVQARISDCFNWIAQDHLFELHPAVWALAPLPGRSETANPDDADLVKRGRTRAISALAEHFAPLLDNGRRLVFTPTGLKMPRMV